jgi:hypothetical protein
MQRYFFDIVGGQRSNCDYRGREFPTPEGAFELAELMALDLAIDANDERIGYSINVSTADGRKLFSVPVQACACHFR